MVSARVRLPGSGEAEAPAAREWAYVPAYLRREPCYLEILIPARDEARRLPHALMRMIRYLEAQPYSSSLVVIDNGSVDRTVDLVRRLRSASVAVQVIGCAQPGKGAAVRRGILTSRAPFLGSKDAPLATPIETPDFVVPPLAGGWPAVLGSRRVGGATYAPRQTGNRFVGGMLFRKMAHRILPGIADTQCGFKFFDGNLARAIAEQLHVEGFAFDVEFLRAVGEMGVGIAEIPVVWSEQEGSTLHALRDGARAATDVLRPEHRRGY